MSGSNPNQPLARAARLGDVVTEKQPLLHPQDSVQQAGEKMRHLGAAALPVTEGRQLVGIVEQPNPDRRAAGFGHDPEATKVGDIMNENFVYCLESDDCAEALRRMNERQLDRLPVVDRELRVVGIVIREDLLERSSAGPAA